MGRFDLHVHTTASDGRYTAAQIVARAHELGLSVIAITDHDSVDGVKPALEAGAKLTGITVIPGVEINTDVPDGEAHILGYFVDYEAPILTDTLFRLRNTRITRAQEMIVKLGSLGLPLEWKRVQEIAGAGSVGRPHIAQAMLEKGYITSLKEAFNRYISRGGPAYVERTKITPEEAVELVLQSKGLPVLGHPFTIKDTAPMISKLQKVGLVGLEVYYNGYTPEQIQQLLSWAQHYGLLATGGSDYHGLDETAEIVMGGTDIPAAAIERFLSLAKERGLARH